MEFTLSWLSKIYQNANIGFPQGAPLSAAVLTKTEIVSLVTALAEGEYLMST